MPDARCQVGYRYVGKEGKSERGKSVGDAVGLLGWKPKRASEIEVMVGYYDKETRMQ